MQDLTRDEAIAFATTDHHNNNTAHTISNNTNNNKLHYMCSGIVVPKFHKLEHLLPCIKVESDSGHSLDAEAWPRTGVNERLRLELNTTRLLLQGSDDPLISHGASTDAHDEDQDYPFKGLIARKTEPQQVLHNGACSTLTRQQLKANLMNGRKVQKQLVEDNVPTLPTAVTPTPAPTPTTRSSKSKKRSPTAGAIKLRFHHQALPAEYAAHYEATQARQLSKAKPVAPAAPTVKAPPPPPTQNQAHENVRSWLRKIAEIQRSAERQQQAQESSKDTKTQRSAAASAAVSTTTPLATPITVQDPIPTVPSSKRSVVKYADLPYMGEITLDNYKPRRGRKPKKADICHLIYKNYGTIIPVTAPVTVASHFPTAATKCPPDSENIVGNTGSRNAASGGVIPANVADEPLNLCLRDQSSDRYSISSSDSDKPSTMTTPTTVCDSPCHSTTPLTDEHISVKPMPMEYAEEKPRIAAKLLLKPMGIYYQQILESCRMGVPVETIEKDNQLALKIPIPNGFFATTSTITTPPAKRETVEQPTEMTISPAMRKRKRSAIFIPPTPAENSTSPSTEVSICKFKFTGGAKPTLQEKKMLSVDAEGNYRYYNGTGDRSMRGYEFISRDQQQPQPLHPVASSHGGIDKLYIDIPPPSTDLSLELLHIPPESPTSSLLMPNSLVHVAPQSPSGYSNSHSPMRLATPYHEEYPKRAECSELLQRTLTSPRPVSVATPTTCTTAAAAVAVASKRRSSRRSKQREKLEKTFKEKGFLIQTQQLQSAEGATYCKFRQLKKFTRYLFRNWKDHIPDGDLDKHQSMESENNNTRGPHGVIENILTGQIGLAVEPLATAQTASNQAN